MDIRLTDYLLQLLEDQLLNEYKAVRSEKLNQSFTNEDFVFVFIHHQSMQSVTSDHVLSKVFFHWLT